MVLTEWKTEAEQLELLTILQRDGAGIPNNLVLDTSIRYSLEKRYPASHLHFLSTKTDENSTPRYVFVFEENSHGFSCLYVRPPPAGHDHHLLKDALTQLFDQFENVLEKDGQIRMISDSVTRQTFLSTRMTHHFDVSTPTFTAGVFYMTDEQMEMARNMEPPVISGFHIDTVDIERDAAKIHDNWKNSFNLESTKACLNYLPSSVVRHSSTGDAVAWDMSSIFGALSNLFTIPEFRDRGLAVMVQKHLIKNFVSQGLRPFKYVAVGNSRVLAGTRRLPFWTTWEEKNDKQIDENSNDLEEVNEIKEVPYFIIMYTTITKKA